MEAAVLACIAAFSRRGYALDETSYEVRYFALLFLAPRHSYSSALKEMADEFDRLYVRKFGQTISTSIEPGDTDDRRNFSDDQLAALDRMRISQRKPFIGGDI